MVDYVKATNFFVKDSLLVGNPDKIVKGSEIDTEYNNIATAVASKANYASPNLTGLPTAPTAAAGTNTSQIASTAFVKNSLDAATANIAITGGTIDNVDITGGTIVDLDTPLAVNSGGTGKATLALNTVLLGNGTAAVKEVAPGASGNVLRSDGTTWVSGTISAGVGDGQTWQDVTASRTQTTTYTNDTSKPILVIISNYRVASAGFSNVTVNGVIISKTRNVGTNDVGTTSSITFIVPVGGTYSISNATTIEHWAELR
jgi:hypothetical protein